jgi:subtilisin family serine protease
MPAFLAALALTSSACLAQAGPPAGSDTTAGAQWKDELVDADGRAAIFIQLQGEPAVFDYARALQAAGGTGPMAERAAGSASRAAVAGIEARQAAFATRLAASGIAHSELFRVSRVLNGIAVTMTVSDMAAVRGLPGVARVEFLPRHWPTNGSSVPFVGAPPFWEGTPLNIAGYKGEGMRIGIIDTGLDYQHPDFGGSGVLVDYQANDRTVITDQISGQPIFPTAKVTGGWDFVGDAYNGSNSPAPDPDPMDCNGHGSHVAGSAAGFGVKPDNTAFTGPWDTTTNYGTLKIGPGVAPRAQLYGLRVFGCGGSTGVTVAAIERAQDPNQDGDLSDRLDVINMSLGSNFGLPFDASAEASDNATLSGMIVVTSAGNAADTFFISGSPGSARAAIATANILDAGLPGPIRVNSPPDLAGYKTVGAASFGVAPPFAGLTADVSLVDDGSSAVVPPTAGTGTIGDGCQTPFLNAAAVAGKIAFLDRGGCGFKLKSKNAQDNGAVGVIIGNLASSANPTVAPGMADDPLVAPVGVPVVSVALADANAFRSALGAGSVNATINVGADTPSASTSRGPGGTAGQIYLKPDVAAPGSSITSAQTGVTCNGSTTTGCQVVNASGYIPLGAPLVLSGTSMASPHVAGYAALVRQQNPGASVAQVKAIVVNSAAHDITAGPGGLLDTFPVSRVGSGRIDIPKSLSPISAFNDAAPELVALTFNVDVIGTVTTSANIRLQNRTAIPQKVDLALDLTLDSPGVQFSLTGPTSQVNVPANGSVLVPVQMSADAASMDRQRDPTMAATQGQGAPAVLAALGLQPRHYMAEESANLIVSKSGSEIARVPVYMAHRPHSDMQAALPSNAVDGNVPLALSGTGVCTGTLAGSNCTGNFGTTDQVSLVSPFELQYTGAPDDQLNGFANVHYVGVNHDPATDAYLFGIATYGGWGTPTHVSFSICVDGNEDGQYEKLLYNTNTGTLAIRLGQNVSGQDVFINAVYTPAGGTTDVLVPSGPASATFVNMQSAAQADTALLANNVAVLAATGTQLGLTGGNTGFRYKVAVCPGFAPNCLQTAVPAACSSPSATTSIPGTFNYNSAAKGITTSGGLANLPILLQDLPGATLNIGYNQANMSANASTGLLLLHHHNSLDNSAQAVAMDNIFADDFDD